MAFAYCSGNMVSGDTNGYPDIFVHDRLNHETARICVDSSGAQAQNGSSSVSPYGIGLSADGRWVSVESSECIILVAGDTNGTFDLILHNRLSHKTTRVSVDSDGVQG